MNTVATVNAVIDALERAPRIVVPLVREVPPANLKRRPPSGKWSAHEHACHLAVVHRIFFERLELMLRSPAPVITPYDPGTQDPPDALLALDLDECLDRFAKDRAELVRRLRGLPAEAWARTAEHGEYGHYSVFIMFRHLALHDFVHAYRIEELLLRREWSAEHAEPTTIRGPVTGIEADAERILRTLPEPSSDSSRSGGNGGPPSSR